MDDDRFAYVDGVVVVVGRVFTCTCGRRLYAGATAVMPRDVPEPYACCLDCLTLSDGFRAMYPVEAAMIDRWKGVGDG